MKNPNANTKNSMRYGPGTGLWIVSETVRVLRVRTGLRVGGTGAGTVSSNTDVGVGAGKATANSG